MSLNQNYSYNYQHLLYKELTIELRKHSAELMELIKNAIPTQHVIDVRDRSPESQKDVLSAVMKEIKQTEWGRKLLQKTEEKILASSKDLYEFDTQRNYFLVECFRESTLPQAMRSGQQQSQGPCLNLAALYKANINKELRRTLWTKCLMSEQTKMEFFRFDHLACPYNLMEELSLNLVRVSQHNQLRIKENQKDCALRVLEYVVKKWDRIPDPSEVELVVGLVELYAHFTPAKIHELGAVYVGLKQLSQYYFQPDVQIRLENIHRAFELVDPPSYQLLQTSYLPYSKKSPENPSSDLNQLFEHFRLTLTLAYFPLGGGQFIIDQLLIKKRNVLDIYVIFAIMIMVVSDDLEKFKQAKMSILDLLKEEFTKRVIKVEDVVDAFRVIYEGVPVRHQQQTGEGQHNPNHLLEELKKYDQLLEQEQGDQPPTHTNLLDLKSADLENFVKIENKQPLRLGNKM